MKPIEFHPDAEAELGEDLEFYRDRAPGLAPGFVEAVQQALTFIQSHPAAGAPVREALRRWRVPRFPFHPIYREEPARIYLLAVAHQRKRPEYWRDRS